ncbi:MAG: LysR family transcriptional regulator [Paracoccaceae bacterium]
MIDKLEMFIALAQERHFGRAAEECGVTQPTLSAGIKQLEDQLGVMLVWRGSRFRGLTPEGQRVLDWARRIVGDTRAMREEMRAARQGLSGNVRLAVIPTALTMAEGLTTPFRRRHPNVRFTIYARSSIEILAMLENLEIEAGVTYLDNEPLGRVASVPLYRERYMLLARADDPLAGRDSIGWAEVAKLPLALLTPDMQNRRIMNQHFAEMGHVAEPLLEASSVIILASQVISGEMCTILPSKLAALFLRMGGLAAIPVVAPAAEHLVGLVAPHRDPNTPVIAALLDEARRVSEEPGR